MKLFLNTASPYARLIRVLLFETGLDAETELVFVDPWCTPRDLLEVNPAAKIPALSLEDGTHLVESACIADYLVLRSGLTALSPLSHADPAVRLEILGLGRAAIDCAFGAAIQQRFAGASPLTERWLDALPRIVRRLDSLNAKRKLTSDCDQGDLTVAIAFDYMDFRLPQIDWRKEGPHVAEVVSWLMRRASLGATRPA